MEVEKIGVELDEDKLDVVGKGSRAKGSEAAENYICEAGWEMEVKTKGHDRHTKLCL